MAAMVDEKQAEVVGGDGVSRVGGDGGDGGVSYSSDQDGSAAAAAAAEATLTCPAHTTDAKLTARIDLHVVPFLCVLYLLAFLDRVNMANARSFGLEADLNLAGTQYNTCLTIFFVPYVLLEIPSNVLLKRFSPRVWLSVCGMGFGAVSVFQGLTTSFGGLATARFFLGVFESGMFPGCFYLLGMWYRRAEAQKRFSLFFSSTSLAGAFGGLLASAIGLMDHLPAARGLRAWRWIFILEGCLTFAVSLAFLFVFPTFPEQASWLRPDERAYVRARLQADQGPAAADRPLRLRDALAVLRSPRVWLGGVMYLGLIVPAYGYAYFAPTILSSFFSGYSAVQIQLRSVPPWAAAFAMAMLVAAASDRLRHRVLFALAAICVSLAGFAVLLDVHSDPAVQYAALFLVAMGTYSAMPVIVCWFGMNMGGHRRRAIGMAWQVGFGNIGGIIATYSFLSTDAPYYTKGYIIAISFICLCAASCLAYAAAVTWENRKRDRAWEVAAGDVDAVVLTEEEKAELGDLNPEFRYML